ncbi:MAG: helix-turn-helix domain-containing protein [Actinobacteria bacterium]|nr:helix-turn-helix domain-containing protein [Actinomycetota bacterium]
MREAHEVDVVVWRYPDMCRHWGVSRATIERWVRRYEQSGEGIPVHRDPSGRPYWLAHEASGDAVGSSGTILRVKMKTDDRLAQLRRAARRGYRSA